MAPRTCSMQRVDCMASGLCQYALCYCIFVGTCCVTVKTIFFIFLLYVIRVCQSLISMQTDDNSGQLSAERADRGGILRNTTCLAKEKTNSFKKSGILESTCTHRIFLLKYRKFLHINFKQFMTMIPYSIQPTKVDE